MSGLTFSFEKA